jgi:hypothetical protein
MGLFRRASVPMLWHVWPADHGIEHTLLERGLVFYQEEPAGTAHESRQPRATAKVGEEGERRERLVDRAGGRLAAIPAGEAPAPPK